MTHAKLCLPDSTSPKLDATYCLTLSRALWTTAAGPAATSSRSPCITQDGWSPSGETQLSSAFAPASLIVHKPLLAVKCGSELQHKETRDLRDSTRAATIHGSKVGGVWTAPAVQMRWL